MPPCPLCHHRACPPFATVEGRSYFRCPACALTFLDPAQMPSGEEELALYALHENDPDDAGYRAFLARLTVHLLPLLPAGASGLDYGCGPGPALALARMLAEEGHDVSLYDPFFAPDEGVLTDTYDFITCTETVEHFHRPGAEVARLDALLRPGGWLAVMTSWLIDDDGFDRWHYRRDPTHVSFYKRETFAAVASRRGWEVHFPAVNIALLRKPVPSESGNPGGASV